MELEQLLHKHFGYSSFRPGQKKSLRPYCKNKMLLRYCQQEWENHSATSYQPIH